jgi:hypothetical protein
MIGTEKQLMEAIDDLLSQHGAQTPPRLTLGVGSYNGIYPFRTPRKQGSGSVSFSWPRKLLQWLGVSDDDLVKVCATMASTNRICHVYAFHQFLIALRAGKPLLHAMQAIFVAADEVGSASLPSAKSKAHTAFASPRNASTQSIFACTATRSSTVLNWLSTTSAVFYADFAVVNQILATTV